MPKSPIGYGNPPSATRFRKGKSGNPKGRPKGTRNLASDLRDELSERITITEGGVPRKISKQRGFVKSICANAIKGDMRAVAQLVKLVSSIPEEDATEASQETVTAEDDAVLRNYEARLRRRTTGKPEAGDD